MTETRTTPQDFTFVLPDDWVRIRVDTPEHSRKDVDGIVRQLTRSRPDRDSLGPELRSMLDNAVRSMAAEPKAVETYLSFSRIKEFPIAANLTVLVEPPSTADLTEHQVAASFLVAFHGADTAVLNHHGHPVARVVRQERAELDRDHSFDTVVAQYAFVVPGSTSYVLLTFSTPLVQVAEPMLALFETIADSFVWVW